MSDAPNVVYEYGESVIDLKGSAGVVNRMTRKIFEAEGRKAVKRFGLLVHPETGERPTIVLHVPRGSVQLQTRLVTDSPVLREWLISKGVVISEAAPRGLPLASAGESSGEVEA
jgi:hypothetical protein